MKSKSGSHTTPEESLLEAKLTDMVERCSTRHKMGFVGFLDERQSAFAKKLMERLAFQNYMLWGGYEGSERVVFGAFPEYMEPEPQMFPITSVTAAFRLGDTLTHRDFLGAVLALGMERAVVGDILVEPGRGVFFIREEMAPYLLSQLEKIGRVGVSLHPGAREPLPAGRGFEEFSAVVASARLDCVVAACLPCSREKASALIQQGMVMRNHETELSPAAGVSGGDKLSIRGKGRFLLETVGTVTKKGRLHLVLRKYL